MPDPEQRAATADHFDAVRRDLHHDIAAMRDSTTPPRFDEAALDRAETRLGEGFDALIEATGVND